jgi:hypothetical protein
MPVPEAEAVTSVELALMTPASAEASDVAVLPEA